MLLWFVVVIGILAVSGSIYQAVATARDKRNYPPPGQMVSVVGGRRLHLQVTGEDTGKPTVILAAGMGSFSTNWYWVQEERLLQPGWSLLTGPDWAGAILCLRCMMRMTVRPIYTQPWKMPGYRDRILSPVTPTAGWWCGLLPTFTGMRSWAWCW